MTYRRFDIGRQNETLLNEDHYNIFKVLEPYLKYSSPNSPDSGPPSIPGTINEIREGALWLDRSSDLENSELKYYSNNKWNLLFKNRFKITQDIISSEEPSDPIEGQLWIDTDGLLNYYSKGVFKPIKAIPETNYVDANLQGFEDFIIIDSLTASEQTIIDNFSSWLLRSVPLPSWSRDVDYKENDGVVHNLDIYICKEAHLSDNNTEPGTNTLGSEYVWTKVQKLFQYLVPNAYENKFYLDGYFIHEHCPITNSELKPTAIAGQFKAGEKTAQHLQTTRNTHVHDNTCGGYKINNNVSISMPVEMVEGKTANGVHVNPKRLHRVEKKFIMVDKNNPIIEVPEENTEYYGFYGGVGKLLLKTNDKNTTEYTSVISNRMRCIKLTPKAANTYDFIYTIHYEFITSKIKELGTVTKKRQKLNEDNYVWIGPCESSNIAVFAQGLYYAEDADSDKPTWIYDPETEYLYLSEKLQDDDAVKTFDFSVIQFPEKYEGRVTDSFEIVDGQEMFRIVLPRTRPETVDFTVFVSGVNIDIVAGEVKRHRTNSRIIYVPSITRQMYLDSLQNSVANDKPTPIHYCVVETTTTVNGREVNMHRGMTTAKYSRQYGVHVPIYSDPNNPVEGALFLREDEAPILFVDGVLVFQKEIERENDFLTIHGLTEGQEVLLLADYKDPSITEEELSSSLVFEDTVSYATIPTPLSDSTIVYVANSILADASAVYTSRKPIGEGYHGEIRYHINYDADCWYKYDAIQGKWLEITPDEMHIDKFSGKETPMIEVLDANARGYTHSKKSISFLQNMENEVCTYLSYKYSDSVEKQLLMGYCYPNGKDGVNVSSSEDSSNPQPFKTGIRHVYIPGKNELTVYYNGVRQELNSPDDLGFENSKNREGSTGKYNEFILAIDNDTKEGLPLQAEEGYYVYALKKWNQEKTLIPERELTDSEIEKYEQQGWTVELVSRPNKNVIFYVIESCETGEQVACERKTLTYKNALSSEGAYANNTYNTGDLLLTRGNIRVYINGLRQPFGKYQTLESMETNDPYLQAYKILDARTIEIQDPIIGGHGGNEGTLEDPLFAIGKIQQTDGSFRTAYHKVIDTITIEIRSDFKLREITIPIRDNSGEFSMEADNLPEELFRTKDRVMIYINGLAYGKDYKIEDNKIKLVNSEITKLLGNSKRDIITFEWR